MKDKKILFLMIILVFIIALGFSIFFTKKIEEIVITKKNNVYSENSYSNNIDQNENAIKIQGEKSTQEEKGKESLREKYKHLKETDSGYEKSMTEEQFESFIDYAYNYFKQNEGNENADYTPISKYIENICGKYTGFEITEEMIQEHESNMKKLEEGKKSEEIQSESFQIILKTTRDALVRNYGEEKISEIEKRMNEEYSTGNYVGKLSPASFEYCKLMYEIYIDQSKIEEKEIYALWDRLTHYLTLLEKEDTELAEKVRAATDIQEGLYNIGELQEKYKYYYVPRYDELF